MKRRTPTTSPYTSPINYIFSDYLAWFDDSLRNIDSDMSCIHLQVWLLVWSMVTRALSKCRKHMPEWRGTRTPLTLPSSHIWIFEDGWDKLGHISRLAWASEPMWSMSCDSLKSKLCPYLPQVRCTCVRGKNNQESRNRKLTINISSHGDTVTGFRPMHACSIDRWTDSRHSHP